MSQNERILVTGAGGFIGKRVVSHLLAHGYSVRAMLRRVTTLPWDTHPQLECVAADLRDQASLLRAVEGVHAVVHLAAVTADQRDSYNINVMGTHRLVEACRQCGCERIIHFSTQSAKIPRKGIYGLTKSQADEVLHASGLHVTTLWASLVYGEELRGIFGTLVRHLQHLPVIPVLGNGQWLSAPIYIGDAAQAVEACLTQALTIGKAYDLGGPDLIRFDDLIDCLCAQLALRRRKLHIPYNLALVAVKALATVCAQPPITVSNVLGSNQNTAMDLLTMQRDLALHTIDLRTGLELIFHSRASSHGLPNSPPVGLAAQEVAALRREARSITRYLLNAEPAEQLIERYVRANTALLEVSKASTIPAELQFWQRHPRALSLLDAGLGLRHPQSIVRQKIYIMVALLEATPTFAEFFLRPPQPLPPLLRVLMWHSVHTVLRCLVGLLLLAWIRWRL